MTSESQGSNEFEKRAAAAPEVSLLAEFWDFLQTQKKWWLLPILAVLALMGVLIASSASGAAPFIYTLF